MGCICGWSPSVVLRITTWTYPHALQTHAVCVDCVARDYVQEHEGARTFYQVSASFRPSTLCAHAPPVLPFFPVLYYCNRDLFCQKTLMLPCLSKSYLSIGPWSCVSPARKDHLSLTAFCPNLNCMLLLSYLIADEVGVVCWFVHRLLLSL